MKIVNDEIRNLQLWKPGQVIIMREVWCKKVYSIVPVRIVQDTLSWSVLYLSRHTPYLIPHTLEGIMIRTPTDTWVLQNVPYECGGSLYIIQPGMGYTAIVFLDENQNFAHWKINLEEPMHRTSLGFDYMDQLLDIIVSADRSTWEWKDEDEIRNAQARGIFTAAQVGELYQRGERAVQSILANESPFDANWEKWKPDPAWRAPHGLPEGWDRV